MIGLRTIVKHILPLFALHCLGSLTAIGEETLQNFTLSKISGRHWLVGPDGQPSIPITSSALSCAILSIHQTNSADPVSSRTSLGTA